ncbi:DUF3718 domain-containing protein [Thalassotalea maritima]|uniref:DUF3718 domain-containing protein n=1 Tax=Thalassotalea maritima TaxID=3242416 RepID=UPI003527E711
MKIMTLPTTAALTAVLLSTALYSTTVQAHGGGSSSAGSPMSPYMETALIDVCKSSLSNNTIRFSDTVDSYRMKTKTVAMKVVCNGENIADFAANNGAYKTAERLNESLGDVSIEDVALNANEKFYVNF